MQLAYCVMLGGYDQCEQWMDIHYDIVAMHYTFIICLTLFRKIHSKYSARPAEEVAES